VAAVEQLNLVLHAFPLDPELPGLAAATHPAGALALVRAAVLGATGYRVERAGGGLGRRLLRYEVETGDGAAQVVYGRVGGPGLDRRAAADSLRQAVDDALDGAFTVERVLARHPAPDLTLVTAVPGRARLRERPVGELDGDLAACARLLAALHAVPGAEGPERSATADLRTARAELLGVGGRAPALGVRLSRWLARLDAEAGAALPAGPAHGRLTLGSVLFEDGRPGLVGLDGLCLAEPALDLGSLAAHLRVAVADVGGSAQDAEAAVARFLDAYAEAAGADRDLLGRRAALHEALVLARLAVRRWSGIDPAGLAAVLRLMGERRSPAPAH
jgi:hypothetical protein